MRGEVIGINSAIASETGFYAGYGFAIPINLARHGHGRSSITTGKVRARGARHQHHRRRRRTTRPTSASPRSAGVKVERLLRRTRPPKRPGIEPGDIIVAWTASRSNYIAQLQQAIGFSRPGQVVQVEVARKGGVRKTYPVKLIPLDVPELAEAQVAPPADEAPENAGTPMTQLGITVLAAQAGGRRRARASRAAPAGWSSTRSRRTDRRGASCSPASAGGPPEIILSVEGTPVVHRGRSPERAQEARPRWHRDAGDLPCRCSRVEPADSTDQAVRPVALRLAAQGRGGAGRVGMRPTPPRPLIDYGVISRPLFPLAALALTLACGGDSARPRGEPLAHRQRLRGGGPPRRRRLLRRPGGCSGSRDSIISIPDPDEPDIELLAWAYPDLAVAFGDDGLRYGITLTGPGPGDRARPSARRPRGAGARAVRTPAAPHRRPRGTTWLPTTPTAST